MEHMTNRLGAESLVMLDFELRAMRRKKKRVVAIEVEKSTVKSRKRQLETGVKTWSLQVVDPEMTDTKDAQTTNAVRKQEQLHKGTVRPVSGRNSGQKQSIAVSYTIPMLATACLESRSCTLYHPD